MAGRWGSFISGLESKLDTILADEDTTLKSKGDGSISEQAQTRGGLAVPAMPKGRTDGTRPLDPVRNYPEFLSRSCEESIVESSARSPE